MKKFFNDFKKYNSYAMYAAKAELKSEVASSYLTWLWWVLDPLFFMLIYTFIVSVVFSSSVPKLPVFVMVGITTWDFFNKNLITSVKIIRSNRSIITQKYIPKFMLVVQKIYVNFIKYMIGFLLLIILAFIFKVNFSFHVLLIIPLIILLSILSFSLSIILSHFGVFIEDAANIVQIILRLLFYLSGIFYSVSEKLPEEFANILFRLNPMAYIIEDFRNVFMYNKGLNLELYFFFLIISLIITFISVKIVYKHENSYAKVI